MKPNRGRTHKDKRSAGCGLCKPHKHGGSHARTDRERVEHEMALREARESLAWRIMGLQEFRK